MNSTQLVSVIIPVYNREQLIEASIQSVYSQAYRPIECVVIDDGSTDNSIRVIGNLKDKLDSKDFHVICIEQDNAGAPAARNNGIKNASGVFFQFLDSDDLLYPNKIKDQVAVLHNQKEIDGIYGDWHHGTIEDHQLVKGEKWEDQISQFYGGRVIHTLSFLFTRQMIEKIGPWDEDLKRNQEIDYFLRGLLADGNFEYLPSTTGLWREHDGERIVTSSGALSALAFHDKWIEEFRKLGVFSDNLKKTAAYFLFWHAMELDIKHKKEAINYLNKANQLYNDFPEFNTRKIRLLKKILGTKMSIKLWYNRAKANQFNS
jgi:glycosyltransferase involved in cell wall biosynthesis